MLPTEPIGSIPRPPELMRLQWGRQSALEPLYEAAIRDTISSSRRPARRSSPTASSASITTSGPTASTGCRTPRPTASGFRSPPAIPAGCRGSRAGPSATALRRQLPGVAQRYATAPGQAGGHLASALSLMYPPKAYPATRATSSSRTCSPSTRPRFGAACEGRPQGAGRFHRGRLAMKIDPPASCCTASSTSTTSHCRASRRERAAAHRRAYLPRRRSRFDPQRRRRLRRAAAEPVRAQGGQLLRGACRRAGPRAGAQDHPRVHEAGPARFVGVVAPIDPRIETAEEVRDRVLEAAEYIPRRATGDDRRLRLLAVLRRHVHHAARRPSRRSARASQGTAMAPRALGTGA